MLNFGRKWSNPHRMQLLFKEKHTSFLEKTFEEKFLKLRSVRSVSYESENAFWRLIIYILYTIFTGVSHGMLSSTSYKSAVTRGRSRVQFDQSSDRTKRRRTWELCSNYNQEEISKAAANYVTNNKDSDHNSTAHKRSNDFTNGVLAMYWGIAVLLSSQVLKMAA